MRRTGGIVLALLGAGLAGYAVPPASEVAIAALVIGLSLLVIGIAFAARSAEAR